MRIILKEGWSLLQDSDFKHLYFIENDSTGNQGAFIDEELEQVGLYNGDETLAYTNEPTLDGAEDVKLESMFINLLKPTQEECDMAKMVWDLTVPWEEIIWD